LPFALALALALTVIFGAGRGNAASIALELRGLSAEEYRQIDGLALERKLVLRLVQEGFAVVAPGTGADVEFRASMGAAGLALRATSGTTSRSVTIGMAGAPSAEWQLEVAHKVSELARALAPTKGSDAKPPAPAELVPQERQEAPPAKPTAVEQRWELGVSAGAVFRAGGSGFLTGLRATHSLGRWRLHLDVLGTRSRGSEIVVWEAQGSAGLGMALIEGIVALDLGVAAGTLVQHFSVEGPWAHNRAGTSASPGVWLPMHVRWAAGHLVVAGRTALGLARAPTHTSQGATLWSRGSLRLEAGLVMAWAL
jgi:hypothetical protein